MYLGYFAAAAAIAGQLLALWLFLQCNSILDAEGNRIGTRSLWRPAMALVIGYSLCFGTLYYRAIAQPAFRPIIAPAFPIFSGCSSEILTSASGWVPATCVDYRYEIADPYRLGLRPAFVKGLFWYRVGNDAVLLHGAREDGRDWYRVAARQRGAFYQRR